jgi:hypothetical protein
LHCEYIDTNPPQARFGPLTAMRDPGMAQLRARAFVPKQSLYRLVYKGRGKMG